MRSQISLFARTLFRYLYFRMVRFLDLVFNSGKKDFPLEKIHTILLVEVQDIGDTIIASPAIRQIRKRFPRAIIDMLVQNKSIDMVRFNPNLDSVLGVDNITSYLQLFRTSIHYRKKKYDLVVSFSPSVRNNMIAAVCGAKVITGYINDFCFLPTNYHDQPVEVRGLKSSEAGRLKSSEARKLESSEAGRLKSSEVGRLKSSEVGRLKSSEVRGLKASGKITWFCDEPLIVRALKAAVPLGIDISDRIDTELFLPSEAGEYADEFFSKHRIKKEELLAGFHPVCLNMFRNWPPEYFAGLADTLIDHYKDIRVWLIGTESDRSTLDLIYNAINHKEKIIYDTTLSLLKAASVIARCNVIVGMDSCPSDISGALKIPTVHMHGPTSAHVTGPGGRKNYPVSAGVPCSPCGLNVHICMHDRRCMREITIEQVFDATVNAIENRSL
ncbi:hypothetical protein MTBBW1_2200044 [Desulfamplus magnetovallimortis]|uniref:Uncharacterized protein n=1 Tax=Desulfamplus magnetovallimortis TaxID=1246637 RepID=A0A1W1HD38_9BACT|nr:glycosyltransferase family 9 protein [Desulfamplus magnetovallimortis]SLM30390.1 hypothetical protein MTBBW1_2200044 [Desulfamplus magnetovallimortis]